MTGDAATMLAAWRAKFPEFADRDDGLVEGWIDEAGRLAASSEDATLYCAAHLAAISPQRTGGTDSGAGVAASERLGPMTVSYITTAGGSRRGGGGEARRAFFSTSVYGRMMLTIEDRSPAAAMAAVIG